MAASPSLRSVIPWEESAAQSALHRGINKMHAQRASMIPTEFRGVQGLEDRVRPRRIIVIAADAATRPRQSCLTYLAQWGSSHRICTVRCRKGEIMTVGQLRPRPVTAQSLTRRCFEDENGNSAFSESRHQGHASVGDAYFVTTLGSLPIKPLMMAKFNRFHISLDPAESLRLRCKQHFCFPLSVSRLWRHSSNRSNIILGVHG